MVASVTAPALHRVAGIRLAVLPTPLQRLERLGARLGVDLWVKRDDLTGLGYGGNKVRKLERLLADATVAGCDVLVTGGGGTSNHVATAALAAPLAGLDCHLVCYGTAPPSDPLPLALARSCGAQITFTGDDDRASVDAALPAVAAAARAAGRRPYVVGRGGASPVGAAAYADAAAELVAQCDARGVRMEAVLVATGSGGTQAGLVAGTVAAGRPWRVVGAAVSRDPVETARRVGSLAREVATLCGTSPPQAADVDVRDARGPGFGIPAPAAEEMAAVARATEGLLLDPVYTAKALAALPGLAVTGPVLLWHTGGLPAALAALEGQR